MVNAQSAAQRAHLLTGDPQYLTELDAGAGAAAETFAELNRQATAVAGLHLDLARLEHDLASWLAVLRAPVPAPAAPVPAAPTPASPVPSAAATAATTEAAAEAVRAADPAPLLAGTARIADGVAAEKQRLQAATSSDRTRMMVLVGALTAVLPALVGVLVVLGLRRLARPLADLERQVREAAHGDLTAPVVDGSARPGLLRGLFAELEGIRGLMTELRWDARRDQEALDQHGEAAVAVFEFLVAHSEPGPGVDAHGYLVAAEGLVAGDFCDVLALPDGRTALVQGDASGHGVQAGLAGAAAKAGVSGALRLGHGPQVAVEAAWGALADEDERFVTLAVAVLDPRAGTVEWVNAGHEPPVLRRADGAVERLDGTGPLVSSMIDPADRPWTTARTARAPGDLLVLATGVRRRTARSGAGRRPPRRSGHRRLHPVPGGRPARHRLAARRHHHPRRGAHRLNRHPRHPATGRSPGRRDTPAGRPFRAAARRPAGRRVDPAVAG
ncbi:hypothetical protein GCM10025734_15440 [Kitasatospora paranensis]